MHSHGDRHQMFGSLLVHVLTLSIVSGLPLCGIAFIRSTCLFMPHVSSADFMRIDRFGLSWFLRPDVSNLMHAYGGGGLIGMHYADGERMESGWRNETQ